LENNYKNIKEQKELMERVKYIFLNKNQNYIDKIQEINWICINYGLSLK
jgi:hypothetical protein